MPAKKKKAAPKQKQKQKQRQSQRVVVNINQPKRAQRAQRQVKQVQQVPQQIITMSGSVPVPAPYPIQMSGGFTPSMPMPTSLGAPISLSAPVEVPVFANETPIVIGGEEVPIPIIQPVRQPTPVPIVERQPIIVPIKPLIPVEQPVVIAKPPASKQFIKPDDDKSISTILSEMSASTGINSRSLADFLFPKPKSREVDNRGANTIFADNWMQELARRDSVSSSKTPIFFTKENMTVAGPPPSLSTISTRPSFYNPSVKGGEFTNNQIMVPPTQIIFREGKRTNPLDVFSDTESVREAKKSILRRPVLKRSEGDIGLDEFDTTSNPELKAYESYLMNKITKPLKPIKEKKSAYQSLADLQSIAGDRKISTKRANGKNKTREELRQELLA